MTNVGKLLMGAIVIVILIAGGMMLNKGAQLASTGPIKVGFIGPLSGDAAVYGEPLRNVIALAVTEINAEGGIDGRELEIIFEDGQCNGTDAASAMQKLATVDGVNYVLGGFCSGESLAAVPIAEANRVFLLSGGSSSPDLTGVSEYFARTYPSDASQGAVLAEIAYNDKGWEKVAFMQEQTDYAVGVRKAFSKEYIALGGEVIHEQFPTAETDFRTALSKLEAEEPDALFISVQTPAVGERVLQQMQDLDWDVPLMVSDVVSSDAEVRERNAEVLEGAFAAEFGIDESNVTFQSLLSSYEGAYEVEMPFQAYGQTVYDAIYMVAAAITEVGDDSAAVAAWFHDVQDYAGASGAVTIGSDGDRVGGHTARIIVEGETVDYVTDEVVDDAMMMEGEVMEEEETE